MFPFEVDTTTDVPLWVQLRQRLIHLINSGYFKAYLSLVSDGYLESTRGRGVFVRGLDADVGDEHAQEIDAILGDCVASCRDLGLTLDDVQKCMVRKIKQMKREAGEEPAGEAGGGRIVEIDVGCVGRASQTGA